MWNDALFGPFHAAQLASFDGHGCSAVVSADSLPTHALLWHRSPQRLLLVPVSCHSSTDVCVAVEVEAVVAVVAARFAHLSKHHAHAHVMSYNVTRFSPNTPCNGNGMHRSLSDAGRTFTTTLHHVHVLFSVPRTVRVTMIGTRALQQAHGSRSSSTSLRRLVLDRDHGVCSAEGCGRDCLALVSRLTAVKTHEVFCAALGCFFSDHVAGIFPPRHPQRPAVVSFLPR